MRVGGRVALGAGLVAVAATAILAAQSQNDSPARVEASGALLEDIPFDPGSRPVLVGSGARVFMIEDASTGAAPTTGRFARFDSESGWVELPEPTTITRPAAGLSSMGLVVVGLRCSEDDCETAEVVTTTFDPAAELWSSPAVVRSDVEANVWSATFSGSTKDSAVFLDGNDALVISGASHSANALDHPYVLCTNEHAITALVPRAGEPSGSGSNLEEIEIPRVSHVAIVEIPADGSSGPRVADADPAGVGKPDDPVTPICVQQGLLLVARGTAAVWSTATQGWSTVIMSDGPIDAVVQALRLQDGRTIVLTATALLVVSASGDVSSAQDLPKADGFALRQVVEFGSRIYLYEHPGASAGNGQLHELPKV